MTSATVMAVIFGFGIGAGLLAFFIITNWRRRRLIRAGRCPRCLLLVRMALQAGHCPFDDCPLYHILKGRRNGHHRTD